jgi:hypothetical protein
LLQTPRSAAEIISFALQVYRRYPLLFALLALGVVAPYELIVLAVTGRSPFGQQSGTVSSVLVLSLLEFAVVGPLISALHIHAVQSIAGGEQPDLGEVAARGLRVLPTVAAAQIVATLGIGLGFILLVIPGVLLLLRWAVVAQAAAIENESWIDALRRSAQLTRGNYLHVLGLVAITGVVAIGLRDVGLLLAGSHAQAQNVAVGIVVETVARSFMALTFAVLFFDLVARRAELQ